MLVVVFIVFVVCLKPLTFQEPLHVTSVMKDYDPFGILTVVTRYVRVFACAVKPFSEFVFERQGIQESSEKSV